MSETIEFIKDRGVKTISAAKDLAPDWVWPEMTSDQMQGKLESITGNSTSTPPVVGQEEIASRKAGVRNLALSTWERQLEELHRRTVQCVGMLKNKFRNDAVNLAVVSNLSAGSNSRSETLAEALALESAWTKVAPTWSPTTVNTLAAFGALRKLCAEDLQQAFSDAHADWRKAVETLNGMANDLEQTDEAWYADATRVFAAGTPEGDMIRSTIPTTYVPPQPKTPTPPAPTTGTGKTP